MVLNAVEGTPTPTPAPPTASALDALAVLPPEAARKVAAIIGCEGNPNPERWRFLVWDVYAENGFREYVVAEGRIVAKNLVSQFAVRVNPLEVMTLETIQVDSDAAAALVGQYAKVNNLPVATLRYSLRRAPEVPVPIWKIDCFDEAEQQVGSISVGATEGKVLARLGFVNEPDDGNLTAALGGSSTKRKASSSSSSSSQRSSRPRPAARRQPDPVAERIRRATPLPPRVERRPFRLFHFGRD